ncbi:protein of unknown function DUF239 [Macleaya cordata]|uniref:Neprosin PEP catalytic domain-containing protein n=1 Tax=Macleaya cordata TaxID=56857 RepID=A0A200QX28_MACCD|nr:protein of unknown function DUF239 [Macleaya cordata]
MQEPQNGNWWLIVKDAKIGDIKIGYWPNELFTHLANNASVIRYGGIAGGYSTKKPTPPMGNGHLPNKDYRKACSLRTMKIVDDKGVLVDFDPSKIRGKQDTIKSCYDLEFDGYVDKEIELAMTFGGPGGMCP